MESLYFSYGYPLMAVDDEIAFGSNKLIRKKGEGALVLVSFCDENAKGVPTMLAEHARQLLDEAALSFDPNNFSMRVEKNYLSIEDNERYEWCTYNNYGWAKSWAKGGPPKQQDIAELSLREIAFEFFATTPREDTALSKAIERAASLHRKSRSSEDHFIAFTLMYIALESLLASDVLNNGKSILISRALKLITPAERCKMKDELSKCYNLRNDLVHRAGGAREQPSMDSMFEPCTETLRILFRPVFAFLCLRKKDGCKDLPNAWDATPDDSLLVSFETSHGTIAITGLRLPLSDPKPLSASPSIQNLLTAKVRAPAKQYGPHPQ